MEIQVVENVPEVLESATTLLDLEQYDQIIMLLTELSEVLRFQYVLSLFFIGVVATIFVLVLLYKFIRLFR